MSIAARRAITATSGILTVVRMSSLKSGRTMCCEGGAMGGVRSVVALMVAIVVAQAPAVVAMAPAAEREQRAEPDWRTSGSQERWHTGR